MSRPYPPRRPQQPPQQPYPPAQRGHPASPPPQARYQQPAQRQPVYAQPPAPRRRVWPWVLLGIVVAPVLMFVACTAAVGGAVTAATGAPAQVVYELVGDSGSASSVTYNVDAAAGIAQEAQAGLPWRKEVTFSEGVLRVATLTAQNGQRGGNLTCRITVDGQVVREITSSGQYAVVTCATEAF